MQRDLRNYIYTTLKAVMSSHARRSCFVAAIASTAETDKMASYLCPLHPARVVVVTHNGNLRLFGPKQRGPIRFYIDDDDVECERAGGGGINVWMKTSTVCYLLINWMAPCGLCMQCPRKTVLTLACDSEPSHTLYGRSRDAS